MSASRLRCPSRSSGTLRKTTRPHSAPLQSKTWMATCSPISETPGGIVAAIAGCRGTVRHWSKRAITPAKRNGACRPRRHPGFRPPYASGLTWQTSFVAELVLPEHGNDRLLAACRHDCDLYIKPDSALSPCKKAAYSCKRLVVFDRDLRIVACCRLFQVEAPEAHSCPCTNSMAVTGTCRGYNFEMDVSHLGRRRMLLNAPSYWGRKHPIAPLTANSQLG